MFLLQVIKVFILDSSYFNPLDEVMRVSAPLKSQKIHYFRFIILLNIYLSAKKFKDLDEKFIGFTLTSIKNFYRKKQLGRKQANVGRFEIFLLG